MFRSNRNQLIYADEVSRENDGSDQEVQSVVDVTRQRRFGRAALENFTFKAGVKFEMAKGALFKAIRGESVYVEGIEYGQKNSESDEQYERRMRSVGRRGMAMTAGIVALAATVVAYRLGGFDGLLGSDGLSMPHGSGGGSPSDGGHLSSESYNLSSLPHQEVHESVQLEVKHVDSGSNHLHSHGGHAEISQDTMLRPDGTVNETTTQAFFESINEHKVQSGESVSSLSREFLQTHGITHNVSAEVDLTNSFIEQYGDQLGPNNWLMEGQTLVTAGK